MTLPPFDDPTVQAVYSVLCSDDVAPYGEHWEGYTARRIVAAVAPRLAAAEQMAQALDAAISQYGKPGGPWNVPGDLGGWLQRARTARAAWEATR